MNFFDVRKKRKLLAEIKNRRHAEDDLLSPALRSDFDALIAELEEAPAEKGVLQKIREKFLQLPLPEKRGTMFALLDLIVVVGAVAFGLRGLYFQPFRIPTGSMQPTLFGVHHQQVEGNANPGFGKLPGILNNLVYGAADAGLIHRGNGGEVKPEFRIVPGRIFDGVEFMIGKNRYTLPGNPRQVLDYSALGEKMFFPTGERISSGFVTLGDHLFVERVSIYLTPLKRGDVVVFNTEDLFVENTPLVQTGGYYYIKRLAALPGDTVKIVDNQLYVRPAGEKVFRRILCLQVQSLKL